ncbi:hypothetical protein SMICM304S_01278 [Streptomyces microflavus]
MNAKTPWSAPPAKSLARTTPVCSTPQVPALPNLAAPGPGVRRTNEPSAGSRSARVAVARWLLAWPASVIR